MSKNKHWLIIGAGLAGSQLAYRLLELGDMVTIVDANPAQNTSRTAAGLINPITGKRLVKTPGFDNYFHSAMQFYKELEIRFQRKLFFPLPMLRLFQNESEQLQYLKRINQIEYQHLLGETLDKKQTTYNASNGGVYFQHSGYVDTSALLDGLHQLFRERELLLVQDFDYRHLIEDEHGIVWQGKHFNKVIFCEGYHLEKNPWFNYLPLQGAKGEIVTLEIDDLSLNSMVNSGQWLVPRHDGSFRYGATHYWQPLDEIVNQQGVRELLQHLDDFFINRPLHYQVKKIEVGVRPATRDRQPFLGVHPQHQHLAIFNGFGAKGSLMIPWFSQQMCHYLLHHQVLSDEADIRRFPSP